MARALYSENNPFAAQQLRNLIAEGRIAPGDVDERDIRDLRPIDLIGYTQFHAFAGVGIWSLALRNAGWPDDREVWTASCPCQPFSAAGRGRGFADERHLWPAWLHLARFGEPEVVLGEQVASQDGFAWLDLVQADLEGENYACGAIPFPAAGVGAPHERHRIYFAAVAHAYDPKRWAAQSARHIGNRPPAERHQGDGDAWQRLHGPDWRAFASELCRDPDVGSDRLAKIKAFGNAIVERAAREFIASFLESEATSHVALGLDLLSEEARSLLE